VYEVTAYAGEGVRIFDGRGRLIAKVIEHRPGDRCWRVGSDPTLYLTQDDAVLAFIRGLTANKKGTGR
jgi:hypothetical protein